MKNPKKRVIAIDGPAGSGKSTTAKLVAKALKIGFLDTGAMYRAITFKALEQQLDFNQPAALVRLAANSEIRLRYENAENRVYWGPEDITAQIRQPEVSAKVAVVAAIPEIRNHLVARQRELARNQSLVAEGRDIGTVVFPEADLKFFMVASIEARAQRRYLELAARKTPQTLAEIEASIQERDRLDSEREASPLIKAPDAIELDTSHLTIEEQVAFIVTKAKELIL
jgi:cytidylate kinase